MLEQNLDLRLGNSSSKQHTNDMQNKVRISAIFCVFELRLWLYSMTMMMTMTIQESNVLEKMQFGSETTVRCPRSIDTTIHGQSPYMNESNSEVRFWY